MSAGAFAGTLAHPGSCLMRPARFKSSRACCRAVTSFPPSIRASSSRASSFSSLVKFTLVAPSDCSFLHPIMVVGHAGYPGLDG